MTLMSDLGRSTARAPERRNERVARGVGVALGKCLQQALESGRLRCGILSSASLLQTSPERVLLCVLPVTSSSSGACDHALHIHHTLITAFCTEHCIRFLKVNEEDLIRAMTRLTNCQCHCQDSDSVRHSPSCHDDVKKADVTCVLISSPDEGLSFEDEVVLGYYDDMVNSSVFPKPVLNIPG